VQKDSKVRRGDFAKAARNLLPAWTNGKHRFATLRQESSVKLEDSSEHLQWMTIEDD
jgi:hypothetical protein